jgi:hypothetical protein
MIPQDETIPQAEALVLRLSIATARECAGDGRLGDGYSCLLQGLTQARNAFARGESWGAELVVAYLQGVDDYIERYGVRME